MQPRPSLELFCAALAQNRVQDLPTPRPKKSLPQRTTNMLVLRHQGEILLEKRPPSGIWGGLWSFPEIEDVADAAYLCGERFGLTVQAGTTLPAFDHAFTHFKLRITPQQFAVTRALPHAAQPGQIWLTLEDALEAAIPTPARKVLLALLQGAKLP